MRPVFFGQRDELGGAERALGRMLPAHQRLHADDCLTAHKKNGLVFEIQFAIFDRPLQGHFQMQGIVSIGYHGGFKDAVVLAKSPLRFVHGDIRLP